MRTNTKPNAPRQEASRLPIPFALGFFSIAAQALSFRYFFTSFESNEPGISAFFFSWLLWVSIGALIARLPPLRKTAKSPNFENRLYLYIPAFILQCFLTIQIRGLAGIPYFEIFPFTKMFAWALLVNAPVSCLTGIMFTLICEWFRGTPESNVTTVYIAEASGSVCGGILVTALLFFLPAAATVFLIITFLLATILTVYQLQRHKRAFTGMALIMATAIALSAGGGNKLNQHFNTIRWNRLVPSAKYGGSFSTPRDQYIYGTRNNQFNVVSGHTVIETLPRDAYAGELAALTLSQKPDAERIIIIGEGSYALCRQLLLLPQIINIAWLYTDPAYGHGLFNAMPESVKTADPHLHIPGVDIQHYLADNDSIYDLAIINLPDPSTLELNRFFTRQFFKQIRKRLAPEGVLAVRISGGDNYLGAELTYLGASLFTTLQSVFPNIGIKPGDETWFIASSSDAITQDAGMLQDNFAGIPGAARIYSPEGVASLYPEDRAAFQFKKYNEVIKQHAKGALLNTEDNPRAMFHTLLLLVRQIKTNASFIKPLFRFTEHGWIIFLAGILLYGGIRGHWRIRNSPAGKDPGHKSSRFDHLFLVFSTGLTGLVMSIVLMVLYQARFGSIYLHMGLISAMFMLGILSGSMGCRYILRRRLLRERLFVSLLLIIQAIFCLLIPACAKTFSQSLFVFLFFLCGLFSGCYIPMAAHLIRQANISGHRLASSLEMTDHMGGAAGAFLAGMMLIPAIGTNRTLLILAALLLINLPPLFSLKYLRVSATPDTLKYRSLHVWGYVMAGLMVWMLVAGYLLRSHEPALVEPAVFRELAGIRELTENSCQLNPNEKLTYYSIQDAQGNDEFYLFSTKLLSGDVAGYGGKIDVAVKTDRNGLLIDFRVLEHHETPAYMNLIQPWLKALSGRNIFKENALQQVDAVTGATYTSQAVRNTLATAGQNFTHYVLKQGKPAFKRPAATPGLLPLLGIIIILGGMIRLRYKPVGNIRNIYLIIVALLAGFVFNVQYSTDHLYMLLTFNWPADWASLTVVITLVVPFLVILTGNIYCGYLCPFGALQELAGRLRPKRLQASELPPRMWQVARSVKYVFMFILVLFIVLQDKRPGAGQDPLISFFSHHQSPGILLAGILLIGLSVCFNRFWCRTLCPAGAFLSLLNGFNLLKRIMPRLYWRKCDLGIYEPGALDCICCDRCRTTETINTKQPGESSKGKQILFVSSILLILTLLLSSILLPDKPTYVSSERPEATGTLPYKMPSAAKARKTDINRIKSMVKAGQLSDKEALYYLPLTNTQSIK